MRIKIILRGDSISAVDSWARAVVIATMFDGQVGDDPWRAWHRHNERVTGRLGIRSSRSQSPGCGRAAVPLSDGRHACGRMLYVPGKDDSLYLLVGTDSRQLATMVQQETGLSVPDG